VVEVTDERPKDEQRDGPVPEDGSAAAAPREHASDASTTEREQGARMANDTSATTPSTSIAGEPAADESSAGDPEGTSSGGPRRR
jgi:hypothetical protein